MGSTSNREVATLGGGCFWCLEPIFRELRGVDEVVSGYAGGSVLNPTYEQVCSGRTGHAEVLQVTFDPAELSYRDLLEIFLVSHDPTTLNRQGNDVGPQYRSIILSHSPEQQATAKAVIADLNAAQIFNAPIVTEVAAFDRFYPAEAYHQYYYDRNPNQGYCRVIIAPKLAKFRQKFADRRKVSAAAN